MLVEAVFKIGCETGVVLAIFLDYVEVPHIVSKVRTPLVTSFLGASSQGPSLSEEMQGGQEGPLASPRVGLEPTT